MKQWLCAFISTLLLAGCAGLKGPVPQSEIATSKHLGVVSLMSNQFHGVSIGTTVFQNSAFEADVSHWQINDFAEQEVLRALSTSYPFEVSIMSWARVEEAVLEQEDFWRAAANQHYDRLLVLRPVSRPDMPQFKKGYGFSERSLLGIESRCIYAFYTVSVYDVATRNQLGWELGGELPCKGRADMDLPFKPSFADYTPQQQSDMQQRLRRQLSDSIRYAIRLVLPVTSPIN